MNKPPGIPKDVSMSPVFRTDSHHDMLEQSIFPPSKTPICATRHHCNIQMLDVPTYVPPIPRSSSPILSASNANCTPQGTNTLIPAATSEFVRVCT